MGILIPKRELVIVLDTARVACVLLGFVSASMCLLAFPGFSPAKFERKLCHLSAIFF